MQYAQSFTTLKFLSTLSLRRATTDNSTGGDNHYISIHALLAESDGPRCKGPWVCFPFLSTLSLRRATLKNAITAAPQQISIHALLAESDHSAGPWQGAHRDFYPRSPCGERPSRLHKNICGWGFLSTLSLRRATTGPYTDLPGPRFLSTLSLRRATRKAFSICLQIRISIHALLAESDSKEITMADFDKIFLSTLSLRRATTERTLPLFWVSHFYPRSPCGERRSLTVISWPPRLFLSTLSLRRATGRPLTTTPHLSLFLSTLSLRRATDAGVHHIRYHHDFYPRSPCGERHRGQKS